MVTVGCACSSNVVRRRSTFREQIYSHQSVIPQLGNRLAQFVAPGSRCDVTMVVGMVGAGARLIDSKGVEWFGFQGYWR